MGDEKDRRQSEEAVDEDRRQGERRRWRRVAVELWGEASDGEATYFHQAGDLSEGGVFFAGDIPQPEGTVVTIKLDVPDPDRKGPLELNGVVVNATDRDGANGMGVKFTGLRQEDTARIVEALDRLTDPGRKVL